MRGGANARPLGRIAAGHFREPGQVELDAAAARLAELYPESNTDRGARQPRVPRFLQER